MTVVTRIPPDSQLSAQLTQRCKIHGGQLKLRQRSPGSGGHRQIGTTFAVPKTQGSVSDPFRNQHHQDGDQSLELHQPSRQWMQATGGLRLRDGRHAAREVQSCSTLTGLFEQRGGSGQIARVPLCMGAMNCAEGRGDESRHRNGCSRFELGLRANAMAKTRITVSAMTAITTLSGSGSFMPAAESDCCHRGARSD